MWKRLIDAVVPRLCPGCQAIVENEGFCASCWAKLSFITGPMCVLCGDPMIQVQERKASADGWAFSWWQGLQESPSRAGDDPLSAHRVLCRSCAAVTPLFHGHRSLWRYGPLSRKVIFALKHGRQRWLVPLCVRMLMGHVLSLGPDVLAAVPLHPARLAQRGLNQALVLAQGLGRLTGIPVALDALARPIATPSQGHHTPQYRLTHAMGAFCGGRPDDPAIRNKRVLIIDDVYTTGATLNACAAALLDNGAQRVFGLTLAKVAG